MTSTTYSTTEIGALVRRVHRQQGLKQSELAALTNCGPRFIGELERGKSTLQWGKVLAVLQSLGITLSVEAENVEET